MKVIANFRFVLGASQELAFDRVRDINDGYSAGKTQLDFRIKPSALGLGLTAADVAARPDPDAKEFGEIHANGEDLFRYYEAKRGHALNVLLLSGGGQNGAFGAGLLLGWSARGDRPEFTESRSGLGSMALVEKARSLTIWTHWVHRISDVLETCCIRGERV